MADVVTKRLQDLAAYEGPNRIERIRFRAAAGPLGVRAWGMNVLELDPRCTGYPQHDHAKDGQEEVYFIVSGRAQLQLGDETIDVDAGMFVRVGPNQIRKFVTTDSPVTILAIGGTPGQAYPAK